MKIFKKCFLLVAVLALSIAFAAIARAADSEYGLVVNGEAVVFEEEGTVPININGRLLFPLRTLFEYIDDGEGSLEWVDEERMVTLCLGDIELKLWIGDPEAEINGEKAEILDGVAPVIHNDRTYLPLRFVAETFGMVVGWNDEYRTASVVDGDAYEAMKAIFAGSENETEKLAMDMLMNMDIAISLTSEEGIEEDSASFDIAAACEIDTENAFTHITASANILGETAEVELYMLGEQMYMKVDDEWETASLDELTDGLGFDTAGFADFLDMADLEQFAEAYDPYLTMGLSVNDDGDFVVKGIIYLPADLIDSLLGSALDMLGGLDGFDISFQPAVITFVLDKETMALTGLQLALSMSMEMDLMGMNMSMSISYVITIDNIDYAPSFESVIPDEIIEEAA